MCLIWGSTFLAIRIGNESVPPLWGATIRLVVATALHGAIAVITRARWPRGAALRGIALFGFLNMGVNFVLLYWGEMTVPSGIAATFYATVPLSTGIFARLLGLHPLDKVQMLASLAGLAGVALIFSGEISLGAPIVALLAVFAAATCAALAGVILKQVPPHSTFVVNGIGAALGAAVCFLGSLVLGESHGLPRGAAGWGPILYLAVAGNLGAYMLYAWLLTQWKVTSVHVAALIIPVIAVIIGAIIRAESPAPITYAGGALVLAGVATTLFEAGRPAREGGGEGACPGSRYSAPGVRCRIRRRPAPRSSRADQGAAPGSIDTASWPASYLPSVSERGSTRRTSGSATTEAPSR
jgi:drug/metabolite transporter (DMT)-like permease